VRSPSCNFWRRGVGYAATPPKALSRVRARSPPVRPAGRRRAGGRRPAPARGGRSSPRAGRARGRARSSTSASSGRLPQYVTGPTPRGPASSTSPAACRPRSRRSSGRRRSERRRPPSSSVAVEPTKSRTTSAPRPPVCARIASTVGPSAGRVEIGTGHLGERAGLGPRIDGDDPRGRGGLDDLHAEVAEPADPDHERGIAGPELGPRPAHRVIRREPGVAERGGELRGEAGGQGHQGAGPPGSACIRPSRRPVRAHHPHPGRARRRGSRTASRCRAGSAGRCRSPTDRRPRPAGRCRGRAPRRRAGGPSPRSRAPA